jgi:hypothetical protein|nr:MAG TPA: hypothetical protein [Caudoviricetes sp.]
MKKITRTVITHSITFAEVNGTNLEIFETREMSETPGTRFLSALSKERKKQVVVVSDVPIEKKYSMTVDKFIENAELEEVQEY